MIKIIMTVLLSLLSSIIAGAQNRNDVYVGDYQVQLDATLEVNRSHPYIDHFTAQDDLYIDWLYATNKKNMKNSPEYASPATIIKDQDGNNTLIFTLYKEGITFYDTLRNSVHDLSGKHDKAWSFLDRFRSRFWNNNEVRSIQEPRGNLPEGSMMWLEDKNWGLKFGVLVPAPTAHVHIVISNKKGEQVATIVNSELRKGWNNFKWKRKRNPHGIYNIRVTMNGHTMTQNFES